MQAIRPRGLVFSTRAAQRFFKSNFNGATPGLPPRSRSFTGIIGSRPARPIESKAAPFVMQSKRHFASKAMHDRHDRRTGEFLDPEVMRDLPLEISLSPPDADLLRMSRLAVPDGAMHMVDVGCSVGFFAGWMADMVGEGGTLNLYDRSEAGTDVLKSRIEASLAKERLRSIARRIDLRLAASPQEAGVKDGSQHLVRCSRVLTYIPDKQRPQFARELLAAVQPGGSLLVSFYHKAGKTQAARMESAREAVESLELPKGVWVQTIQVNIEHHLSRGKRVCLSECLYIPHDYFNSPALGVKPVDPLIEAEVEEVLRAASQSASNTGQSIVSDEVHVNFLFRKGRKAPAAAAEAPEAAAAFEEE